MRERLNQLGWVGLDDSVWQRLHHTPPQVAILAPQLDTVPSPSGNSIYVLIERIAALSSLPVLVLARWLPDQPPQPCAITDRILYYKPPMPSQVVDKLPHRIKKHVFGTTQPSQLVYPRMAAQACEALHCPILVIEDHPPYVTASRRANPNLKLMLHQHIDSPNFMTTYWWRQAVNAMDAAVFVAQKTKDDVDAHHFALNKPYRVIYNGVDLAHYDPHKWHDVGLAVRQKHDIRADAPLLLYVGRITPGKGPLQAAQAFVQTGLDADFVIVGDLSSRALYGDPQYTQQLVELGQREPRLHVVGLVPQADIPAYYAAADAVIIPTLQSEGLPKVVTEALAMSTSVIASDRGGIWELLDETRNAWRIDDASDNAHLAGVLQSALGDVAALRARNAHIGATDRPRMGEQRMVDEFDALFRQLLTG